jgi:hypothetical protein
MTIIPYISSGCLDSNTLRHFNTIREAVEWAFDDMYTQPDNTDTVQKRFRIIDTEEDFTVSFGKEDGNIFTPLGGWFRLCGMEKP